MSTGRLDRDLDRAANATGRLPAYDPGMNPVLLSPLLGILLAPQAGPEERPRSFEPWSCDIRKTAQVTFSSTEVKDTFEVSAAGSPCWKGVLKIEIRTAKGKALFNRESKLADLFDEQPPWDPALKADLESTVKSFFEEAFTKRSGDLPPYSAGGAEEGDAEQVQIPEEEYNRLRQQNLPVFLIHGYESWQYFIYDPATKKARLIVQGG
jgi:hypothetical protein